MAFILDNLTVIRAQDKNARVQGKFMYRTTDARATVLAADYFLNGFSLVPNTDTTTATGTQVQTCANKFYLGDTIEVQMVDALGNPMDDYRVMISYVVTGADASVLVEELMAGEIVAIGQLADISTASNVDITFGTEVELTKVTTVLGGAIATADDTLTTKLDSSSGVSVDGGSIVVAFSGSAKGDIDMATPYANRTATVFNLASDGASTDAQTLDIVMRGIPTTGTVQKVTVLVPDISTANSAATIASPFSGTIVKMESTLQAVIASANAVVTGKIGTPAAGTAITNGVLTVAFSGSAIGDIDTAMPTAANAVVEGQLLSVISNGGSTNAAPLYVTFYIRQS